MKRDGSDGNDRMGREWKRTVGREGYDRMCTEGDGSYRMDTIGWEEKREMVGRDMTGWEGRSW